MSEDTVTRYAAKKLRIKLDKRDFDRLSPAACGIDLQENIFQPQQTLNRSPEVNQNLIKA